MLGVPYFKQKDIYSCGAASLQMALDFLGHKLDQDKICDLLGGCGPQGVHNDILVKVVRDLGFNALAYENSDLEFIRNSLRESKVPLINYIEPDHDEGHFAVVVSLDEEKIVLQDPWNGPSFTLGLNEFESRWRGTYHGYTRWVMTIW